MLSGLDFAIKHVLRMVAPSPKVDLPKMATTAMMLHLHAGDEIERFPGSNHAAVPRYGNDVNFRFNLLASMHYRVSPFQQGQRPGGYEPALPLDGQQDQVLSSFQLCGGYDLFAPNRVEEGCCRTKTFA